MTSASRIDDAVRLIASWGLADADGTSAPFQPDTATEWSRLLGQIQFERISGLAVEAAGAGAIELSEEQAGELFQAHRDAMTWCLAAEQKLLHVGEAFTAEGIEYAVLKGPALAHTMYTEPCLRPFADLDLLVRSRDYDRTCEVLARLGHLRRRPEPRPGWESRFGKASVHVCPDDGIEVDLHRTLVLGPFGQWIDGDELLDRAGRFYLGGRPVPRLDDTATLVNVALHGALGWARPRLAPLRDLVEVCDRGDIDEERLMLWVRDWHLGAAIARAVALVQASLHLPPPRVLQAVPLESSARDRRLLGAYVGERRATASLPLVTLGAIEGVRAKSRYALGLLFPTREFLKVRGGGNVRAAIQRRLRVAANTLRRPLARGWQLRRRHLGGPVDEHAR